MLEDPGPDGVGAGPGKVGKPGGVGAGVGAEVGGNIVYSRWTYWIFASWTWWAFRT